MQQQAWVTHASKLRTFFSITLLFRCCQTTEDSQRYTKVPIVFCPICSFGPIPLPDRTRAIETSQVTCFFYGCRLQKYLWALILWPNYQVIILSMSVCCLAGRQTSDQPSGPVFWLAAKIPEIYSDWFFKVIASRITGRAGTFSPLVPSAVILQLSQ